MFKWCGLQFCSYAAPVCSMYIYTHSYIMTDIQIYIYIYLLYLCQLASSTMMLFANDMTLCVHNYIIYICDIFIMYTLIGDMYLLQLLPSTVAIIFLVFCSDVHPTSPPCCLGDYCSLSILFGTTQVVLDELGHCMLTDFGLSKDGAAWLSERGSWWSPGDVLVIYTFFGCSRL